jgi:glycosyltransferase involved in cell wall biosynthesis
VAPFSTFSEEERLNKTSYESRDLWVGSVSRTSSDLNYVIVTPVRDEEAYLPSTIESVLAQTILPREWVIVDDGSKDNTWTIIQDYSRRHPWIRGIRRSDRGFRKPGGGIIEAFYSGFKELKCRNWDYMSKLDGDLSFSPDYFEKCFDRFERDSQLGIGGGYLYHVLENGEHVLERVPEFHVRGGVKIYRRACWNAIGGLWIGLGSDTVDEVKANMLGWTSMSFPELLMQHHRFTGATYGRWGGVVKNGKSDYVCGYHPLFMFAKCIARLRHKPYLFGSLGLLYGFLSGYVRGMPRVNDPDLIKYLRQQQIGRLLGRKTIWK